MSLEEYKNINLIGVKFGFGWIRRTKNGDIGGSTYPISPLLEDIDKEIGELKEKFNKLEKSIPKWLPLNEDTIDHDKFLAICGDRIIICDLSYALDCEVDWWMPLPDMKDDN